MSYISTGGATHCLFLHIRLLFSLIVYSLSVKWCESVSKVDISVPGDRKQGSYVHTETCKGFTCMHFSWEHVNRLFVSAAIKHEVILPVQISTNSAAIVIGQEVAVARV